MRRSNTSLIPPSTLSSGYIMRKYSDLHSIYFYHLPQICSNIDRFFAIWQAVYYQSGFTTQQANSAGTFTNKPGLSENINTRK